jgi:para-nitrobenzyl esterase
MRRTGRPADNHLVPRLGHGRRGPIGLWAALLLAAGAAFAAPLDTVRLESGPITGRATDSIRFYLGIPYGAPPVGNLRWRPPQPPEPWSNVRPMLRWGPVCPQPLQPGVSPDSDLVINESCLVLNVWTPARSEFDSLPVMVWIHGGGFLIGGAQDAATEGTGLARRGVVVVTIDYRLGPFGFLAHPALTRESEHAASGNYGILDQIAALNWVRANIARFGGNPNCVTVFGFSAGGISVGALLTSPLAKGLFSRAICQSGPMPSRLRRLSAAEGELESAESLGVRFARNLRVPNDDRVLERLRAKPTKAVLRAWMLLMKQFGNGSSAPGEYVRNHIIVDGWVLPEPPGRAFRAGRQYNLPLMVGTTRDEGTLYTRWAGINSDCAYRRVFKPFFGPALPDALRRYPPRRGVPRYWTAAEPLTDVIISKSRAMARGMARVQPNTWMYQFCRVPGWARKLGLGSTHGAEIIYVFSPDRAKFSPTTRPLTEAMAGYWARFARTGNPNGGDAPAWPAYDSLGDRYIVLDTVITTGSHLRQAYCNFLDSLDRW